MASTSTATTALSSLHPKPHKPEFPKKPLKSLPFTLSTFPLTLNSNTQFRQLLQNPHNSNSQITPTQQRIFLQDPLWMTNALSFKPPTPQNDDARITLKRNDIDTRKYNALRRRQIREETEVWERSVEEYRQLQREMCEKRLAPSLPFVKALFLGWFEPLRDAIEKEQKVQSGKPKRLRAAYAGVVGLLPADKMAVIVMHKVMRLVMLGGSVEEECGVGCVRVVQAAVQIGAAIEHEVRIHSFLEKTKSFQGKKTAVSSLESLSNDKQILRKRVNNFIKKKRGIELQKLLKHEFKPWGRDNQAKLGTRLLELLIETAYVHTPVDQAADNPPDIRPAFIHRIKPASVGPGQKVRMKYGVIECDSSLITGLKDDAKHMNIPYVPMLIPPKKWKGYDKGGHLFLPSYIMRTRGSRKQQDAIKNAGNQMQKVFEALNTLGNTKWRVNKRLLAVVEILWARGGNVAGLVDRTDVPVPERPYSEDLTESQEWKWKARKVKKINAERHSLRCDTELKLSVARKMKDEEGFYYPHNLDFRGRAYPMHPYLNHLSSDLCRGVLEFAEGRPLGRSGLHWLKIHVANLYGAGIDKLSYDGRLAFVENHLDQIFDSAENPTDGNRWWLTAEDPFQFLAACINLSESLRSSSPHTVISHLPIHQDGSCNGLQHYAALGRNSLEAAAVNLVAGEKPSDVYSEIAWRVHDIMKEDSTKDSSTYPYASLAKMLIGQVDRKLVKQTVMTSVYGVTYIGAREQIKKRLQEKGLITDDRLLFSAACYAAKVTLTALGEVFEAARDIMDWLGDCAKVIASDNKPVRWTTPLGLPIVQPYFQTQRYCIKTSLQSLAMQRESNSIEARKQRSAFPPNFVHSLDSSHMMMTAIACRDAGVHFAGVHDSFWTHACDVDKMNKIIRENFVELYSTSILENLLEGFQTSYPSLAFPSIPRRGDFDLREVLESPYFFN